MAMAERKGTSRRGGVALAVWVLVMQAAAGAASGQARGSAPLAARGPAVSGVEDAAPGAYEIERAASELRIDGRLDEPAWAGAVVVPIPFEVDPGDNRQAPVATECRLTYDRSTLYLGCTARDERPGDIRAFLTDRDAIDDHDRIVLTLDPFLDRRRAFQFGVSALGVQSDAILAQQGTGNANQGPDAAPIDPSWDAIWTSEAELTDDGYVVEAAIPFRALRFPRSDAPQTWGMVLTRWWPRSADVELRSAPLDRDDSCVLCQVDRLSGLVGIASGSAVQLAPTLTASRLDSRPEDGGEDGDAVEGGPAGVGQGAVDPEVGLDAQWGLTSDLTLDVTVNPDFSQVEADVAQLDVNQRFALFFPETRPFFLEGADFFGTPIRAVFTRSVAQPTVGTKLTGKVGANALGLLVARDRANNVLLPGPQSSETTTLPGGASTIVGRLRRDVGASSAIGALVTSRLSDGYHNTVGGADLFARPIPSLTVRAQALRSSTRYPRGVAEAYAQPDGSFAGTAASVSARWSVRDWIADASARRVTAGFRSDAGFLPQAGVSARSARLVRVFRGGSDRWFTRIELIGGVWRVADDADHVLDGGRWLGLRYEGPRQSALGIWPNFMRRYDAGQSYEGMLYTYAEARIRPTGSLTLSFDGGFGDDIDYVNGGTGAALQLAPSVELRIGRHLEAELRHAHHRLDRDGGRVFTADLTRLRTVYAFSPRSFVRTVLQRQQVTRPTERNGPDVDPESRWRFTQVTYGYEVSPQTVLYLGYGEDRRGATDALGAVLPLTLDARSFFMKVGYAWRP
jgi:hypothetical protein